MAAPNATGKAGKVQAETREQMMMRENSSAMNPHALAEARRSDSPVYTCKDDTNKCPAPSAWKDVTPPWFYQDDFHGSDPVQGYACDCYFIAALSSVAWTCRSFVIKQDETTNPGYYTILFFDDSASPSVSVTIGVSKKLPVNGSDVRVYATSSTANETWPSVYEKAYAKFWKNLGSNQSSYLFDTLTQAELDSLCLGGNPLASLLHITQPWGYTQKKVKYTAVDYADATAVWTAINGLTNGTKTKFPMVAFTYDDAAAAASALGMAQESWLQKWEDYQNTKIVKAHSYSILGTYQGGGKQYIVLRNPFGPAGGDPAISSNLLYTGSWSYTIKYYKPLGAVNFALGPARGERSPLNLSLPDGIFALEAEAFRAYFKTFGWVE